MKETEQIWNKKTNKYKKTSKQTNKHTKNNQPNKQTNKRTKPKLKTFSKKPLKNRIGKLIILCKVFYF